MTPLLTLEGVSAGYGDGDVISDIDLQIDRGDFVGIVGPSGSGKSTLLRLLLGSVPASSGRFDRFGGTRLGYVPQVEQIDWDFPVTVAQCVLMSRVRGRIVPWASRSEKADVARVLDTTGAGDLFAAGFLFGVTRDLPLVRCAEIGALAAGEVISHVGPRPLVELKSLI